MPYTGQTPKPLLMVDGISLLERNINALYGAGIRDIVINTSWLGSHIQDFVTQLDLPGLHIACVHEGDTPLGTGGGIFNALDHLQDGPFWVINADIITSYNFARQLLWQKILWHTWSWFPTQIIMNTGILA